MPPRSAVRATDRFERKREAILDAATSILNRLGVKGLTLGKDPKCRRAQAEAKRRIAAVYAKYEARQLAFDAREHQGGGRVEKLLLALAGKE